MPLQRFRPTSGSCKLCKGNLELSLNDCNASLRECPKCGQEIEALPNLSSPPARVTKKPSVSDAKSSGFQVYKRLGKGEYEKQ